MTSEWFSGNLIANGIKLHYHRTGGDKPAVVLVHGITDNGLCWTRLAQALAQEYDLIMYDARGHGLSEAPATSYTAKEHVADLAGLVEALGLEKPAIIGHSMGAANVALAIATQPDLTSGAILEDPPWQQAYTRDQAWVNEWRAEIALKKTQTIDEIVAASRAQRPAWSEVEWPAWAEAKQQTSLNVFEWVEDRQLFTTWRKLIPRITCPLLLITGDPELEAIVTPEVVQEVVDLNPGIRIKHISGAGHSIRREQFDLYAQAVSGFLKEIL
jgi:pimeloyl-ACP methyl ester carboxylesterase